MSFNYGGLVKSVLTGDFIPTRVEEIFMDVDVTPSIPEMGGVNYAELQEIYPSDIDVVNKNIMLAPQSGYSMHDVFDIEGRRICRHKFGSYEVVEFYDIFTKEECDKIIDLATKKGMVDSEVMIETEDGLTGLDKMARISTQAWMTIPEDPIFNKFSQISTRLTGLPLKNQESVQVASYVTGGKYEPHFDACVSEVPDFCKKSNRGAGQRRSTLLVYLNDDYEGGKTEFVNLKFAVTPKRGKGILFFSTDTAETIFEESLHKGAEVKSGKKWIATIWSHPNTWTEID